ncbi:alpha/beta fold hydrolase [Serratia ureilytica]|uniref:alpha/beta fold hydrolase n=1 Tax=Serratia ureilytica TaxID=300181 RepID=UPI0032661D70
MDVIDQAAVSPLSNKAKKGTVYVKGAPVNYYDSGTPQYSSHHRRPIVLVHGTGGNSHTHYGYLFPILELNQRVIALDFSPIPDKTELTLEDLEDQIIAVIEKLIPDTSITLVGYSLGAVVAASLAAKWPNLVRNLVLIAGWMKTDDQQLLRNSVWQELYYSGNKTIAEFTLYCALSHTFYRMHSPEHLRVMIEKIQPSAFDAQQMSLNRQIDISDKIDRILACTLIVGCRQDLMVPIWHSKLLFGSIIDARYQEIDSGHGVVFERPGQLSQIIDQFNENPTYYTAGSIIPEDHP